MASQLVENTQEIAPLLSRFCDLMNWRRAGPCGVGEYYVQRERPGGPPARNYPVPFVVDESALDFAGVPKCDPAGDEPWDR